MSKTINAMVIGVAGSIESCRQVESSAKEAGVVVVRWDDVVGKDMAFCYDSIKGQWFDNPTIQRPTLSVSHSLRPEFPTWLAKGSEDMIRSIERYCEPHSLELMMGLWAEFRLDTEGEGYWPKLITEHIPSGSDQPPVVLLTRVHPGVSADVVVSNGGRIVMAVDYEVPVYSQQIDFAGDIQAIITPSFDGGTVSRWVGELFGKEAVNEQGSSSSANLCA